MYPSHLYDICQSGKDIYKILATSLYLINIPLKIADMKVQILTDLLHLLTTFLYRLHVETFNMCGDWSFKISTFMATIYIVFQGVINKKRTCRKSNVPGIHIMLELWIATINNLSVKS